MSGLDRILSFTPKKLAIVSVLVLAGTSYITTARQWDGGFPSGEIRVSVVDADGHPIPDAAVRVFRGSTNEPAFEYPIANHAADTTPRTDKGGVVILWQRRDGLQFGGFSWELFWIIPFGATAPEYSCTIEAEGYKTQRFDIWRLFDSPYLHYDDFPKSETADEDGYPLKLFDQRFALSRID